MPTHPYLRRERREFIGPLVVSRRLSHAGLQKFNQSSDWLESFVNVRTSASVGRQVALFGWFFFLLLLCSSADAHMRLVADGTAATKTKPTRSFCWFIFFSSFLFFSPKASILRFTAHSIHRVTLTHGSFAPHALKATKTSKTTPDTRPATKRAHQEAQTAINILSCEWR